MSRGCKPRYAAEARDSHMIKGYHATSESRLVFQSRQLVSARCHADDMLDRKYRRISRGRARVDAARRHTAFRRRAVSARRQSSPATPRTTTMRVQPASEAVDASALSAHDFIHIR